MGDGDCYLLVCLRGVFLGFLMPAVLTRFSTDSDGFMGDCCSLA